jgi:hypothetical protein
MEQANLLRYDPLRQSLQPFSPLVEVVARQYAREADGEALLESLDVYPRHRALWKAILTGEPCRAIEPVIHEEIHQERIFLRRDMGRLLAWAGARDPVVVLCHHAELLPTETLRIMEEEEGRNFASVMVLLCFSARPGKGSQEDEPWAPFFDEHAHQRRILILQDESPAPAPIDGVRVVSDAFEPSIVPARGFGPLLDFLQFETVIRWGLGSGRGTTAPPAPGPAEEMAVLEALSRGYEGAG